MRPTALRADVYAGTERPVGIHRKPIKQHDLPSTALRATTCCSTLQSSVAVTRNGVKNFSEIHFSLRRRGQQRFALANVPRRTDRPIEGERATQLLVGFGATSLV